MKFWMVATYKINELKRLQENLNNQNFDYYNPKIITKKKNLSVREELLFPGYIFIQANLENYQKIKYTKGINKVLSLNNNVAFLENDEIDELKRIEENSFKTPIIQKIYVGQEGTMSDGPFKGSLITIASLPKKNRVDIFVYILGNKRRVSTLINEISL
jgi:transcription antitermination factor NusG